MAANTFRNNTSKISMSKSVNSILRCNVVLDRLEQSAIDQIMQNSIEDNDKIMTTIVRILLFKNHFIYYLDLYHSRHQMDHHLRHLLKLVVH
jgi:hypothetical protein